MKFYGKRFIVFSVAGLGSASIIAASAIGMATKESLDIDDNKETVAVECAVTPVENNIDIFEKMAAADENIVISVDTELRFAGLESKDNNEEGISADESKASNDKKEEADKALTIEAETDYNVVNYPEKYMDFSQYPKLAIAKVDSYLNVRKEASTKSDIIGKMPPNAGCNLLSVKDGWAKIKSGDVTGYVKYEYLISGAEAKEAAKTAGRLVVIVDCASLRVRQSASTDSEIICKITKGEELDILSSDKDWIQVEINNYQGYVAREYVNISYELYKASKVEVVKKQEKTSVRNQMVEFAKQYLGNRYVYGGNSLTRGIDCSGFTKAIYARFGYTLPRSSAAQANVGRSIKASEVKPGDLVFYNRGGRIGHVAMYIGGGKIIHASNPRSGIKISNMYYTTPKKVVRIIND